MPPNPRHNPGSSASQEATTAMGRLRETPGASRPREASGTVERAEVDNFGIPSTQGDKAQHSKNKHHKSRGANSRDANDYDTFMMSQEQSKMDATLIKQELDVLNQKTSGNKEAETFQVKPNIQENHKTQSKVDAALIKQELDVLDQKTSGNKEAETFQVKPNIQEDHKTQSKVDAALIKQELDVLDRKTVGNHEPKTFEVKPNIEKGPEDNKNVDDPASDESYEESVPPPPECGTSTLATLTSDESYDESVPPPPEYGTVTLPLASDDLIHPGAVRVAGSSGDWAGAGSVWDDSQDEESSALPPSNEIPEISTAELVTEKAIVPATPELPWIRQGRNQWILLGLIILVGTIVGLVVPLTSMSTSKSGPQAGNSQCETAVTLLNNLTGTNEGFPDSESLCQIDHPSGAWYKIVGTGRQMTLSTCADETKFDTLLTVYKSSDQTCNTLSCVGQSNDDGNQDSCENQLASTFVFPSERDVVYYIVVSGSDRNAQGTFGLSLVDETNSTIRCATTNSCDGVVFEDSTVECVGYESCQNAIFYRSTVWCDNSYACKNAEFHDSAIKCKLGNTCSDMDSYGCGCCDGPGCLSWLPRCEGSNIVNFCNYPHFLGRTCKAWGNPACDSVQVDTPPPWHPASTCSQGEEVVVCDSSFRECDDEIMSNCSARCHDACQRTQFEDSHVQCATQNACNSAEFEDSKVECVRFEACRSATFRRSTVFCDNMHACIYANFHDSHVACKLGSTCAAAQFSGCSCCNYEGCPSGVPRCVDIKDDLDSFCNSTACKDSRSPICKDHSWAN